MSSDSTSAASSNSRSGPTTAAASVPREGGEPSSFFTESRLATLAQAAFVVFLGGAFSYGGFQFGLKRQIERAKTEFDTDKRITEIDPNKVGPSGVPAKSLALKAFARGSALAVVAAGFGGLALSFAVEAKHKGVSKEQEEREMQELYRAFGLDTKGRPTDEVLPEDASAIAQNTKSQ